MSGTRIQNTQEFLHASPEQKAVMIEDGHLYLSEQFSKLATELKTLNSWLRLMPEFIESETCSLPNQAKLAGLLTQVNDAHDDLSDQFIAHAKIAFRVAVYVNRKQK